MVHLSLAMLAHVGGTVWSLGGGPWPLEPPPCPCVNPTMIQGGPVAMPLTPSCQRQAGGPVQVHLEQTPGGSCMPMTHGEHPRTSEGTRLGQMEGAHYAHYSREQGPHREKGRVPPVDQVGGSDG